MFTVLDGALHVAHYSSVKYHNMGYTVDYSFDFIAIIEMKIY